MNITAVVNAPSLVSELFGVSNGTNVTDASAALGPLLGDGTVTSGDTQQTRDRSSQATSATNFRSDFNLDGVINSGAAIVARSRSGNRIP